MSLILKTLGVAVMENLNTQTMPKAARSGPAGLAGWRELAARYGAGLGVLVCGLLLGAAWSLEAAAGMTLWTAALYLGAYLAGGFGKAAEGLRSLLARKLDVNLLMIAAAAGAACIGYWKEGAVLIFIFALSGALEGYTSERSRREIGALLKLKPETALRWADGVETEVAANALAAGDLVLVKPGSRVPADGIVSEGVSSVNEAAITGEAMPADKRTGDEVYAGTINGQGALIVKVTWPGESTLLAGILRLVQEAEAEKPVSQRFMESFERIYAGAVLAMSALLIVLSPPLLGWSWQETWYRAMVFLVVASPCALVASIMPAMLSAISAGARRGILFKGGAHLEAIGAVRVVAFDKTGTLTTGRPAVTDIVAVGGRTERELLQIAASLEQYSEHPLAKAILRHAGEAGVRPLPIAGFASETGSGVRAEVGGALWRLGKPEAPGGGSGGERAGVLAEGPGGDRAGGLGDGWKDGSAGDLASASVRNRACGQADERLSDPAGESVRGPASALAEKTIAALERDGKTVVVLSGAAGVEAIFALRDMLRPEARETIRRLRRMGVQAAMLTGDRRPTAEAIAREAGIPPELVFSGLLPEDKAGRVKALRETHGQVAMVGDGINDAPALASAAVGIAMGAGGSDAALETANVVLLRDELGHIADAVSLGRRASRIAKQNIAFALCVIVALIAADFTAGIALPLGVVGHEGSTILVILNGLRLLRFRESKV